MTRSRALAGVFGSTVLVTLNQTTAAAAAPVLAHRFDRIDLIAWVVGAYLLAATVAGPLFGKAGDLWGRPAALQVALIVVLLASLACGLAWSMPSLLAFRAVQGVGGGGLITVASAAVADLLPVVERPRYQGRITVTTSVLTVAGPVLGGLLIQWASWRWVFLVNVPIVLMLLTQVRRMPSGRRRPATIDYFGAVLLTAGIGALMVGLQILARPRAGGRLPVAGTLAAAGALLLAFLVRERVASEPLVPLRLFADRAFSGCALLSMFGGAALFASSLQLQQFLQIGLGISPTRAGLWLLPMFAGLALASVASGRRLTRRGRSGQHLLAGAAASAAGLAAFAGLAHRSSPIVMTGGMLLLGCGLGVLLPTLGLVTQTVVPAAQLGAAMSVIMLLRSVGGAVGSAAVGSLVAARLAAASAGPPGARAAALVAGFPALIAIAVPAVAVSVTMRHTVVPGLGPRHRAPALVKTPWSRLHDRERAVPDRGTGAGSTKMV